MFIFFWLNFMESWLKLFGVVGLDDLEFVDFLVIGCGVRVLWCFKKGERIFIILCGVFWMVEYVFVDFFFGLVLCFVWLFLFVEDILVMYIFFIRFCELGYDGLWSYVVVLFMSYLLSIFFLKDELEVCVGILLYIIMK